LITELNDGNTLSAAYTALLPYIKKAHAMCAAIDFIFLTRQQVTQYGVVNKRADESTPISDKNAAEVNNYWDSVKQSAISELREFLYDNSTDYPLWKDCVYRYGINDGNFGIIKIGKNMLNKRVSQKIEAELNNQGIDYPFDYYYNNWYKNYISIL
jgi:hypothetical protein